MSNIILAAGAGTRFKNAGYKAPKPLIEVSGQPMIVHALNSAPENNNWVFVLRQEHTSRFKLDKTFKKMYPECKIKSLDKLTEGQAISAISAIDLINMNEPVFIGSCDNGMTWSKEKYLKILQAFKDDFKLGMVVWSFTENALLASNPTAWGWIDVDEKNYIKKMSVKIPLSEDPYHDQAVVGAFTFRDGYTFRKIVDHLVEKNIRVNNEFYLDSCPTAAADLGYKSMIFQIDQYIGWGTPNDLKTYQFWEKFFIENKGRFGGF